MAADVLGIRLGQLGIEKSDAQPLMPLMMSAKKTSRKRKRPHDPPPTRPASPQPCYQNDNDRDSDEVMEVTPEIFQSEEAEAEGYAPHFLMQVNGVVSKGKQKECLNV